MQPSKSAELPNEPCLPPNRDYGDLSLTREGGWPRVSCKVEIVNPGQNSPFAGIRC